jgi:hypothetical protein
MDSDGKMSGGVTLLEVQGGPVQNGDCGAVVKLTQQEDPIKRIYYYLLTSKPL